MAVPIEGVSEMTRTISEVSSVKQFETWLLRAAPGDIAIYHGGLLAYDSLADPALRALSDRVRACATDKGHPIFEPGGHQAKPHIALGLGLGDAVQKRIREDVYEYWFIKREVRRHA